MRSRAISLHVPRHIPGNLAIVARHNRGTSLKFAIWTAHGEALDAVDVTD